MFQMKITFYALCFLESASLDSSIHLLKLLTTHLVMMNGTITAFDTKWHIYNRICTHEFRMKMLKVLTSAACDGIAYCKTGLAMTNEHSTVTDKNDNACILVSIKKIG